MFGQGYFGKSYFGGTYFGLNVEVIIIVKKKVPLPIPSVSGFDGTITKRSIKLSKSEFDKDKQKVINQLLQEDEELIAIIISTIKAGII